MTRLLVWIALLVGGLVGLVRVPLTGDEPAVVAVAGLRVVAVVLGWYLLIALVLGGAARLSGAARLVRAADVLTLPGVRRLLNGAVGLSLAAGSWAAPAAASAQELSPPPVMRQLDTPAPPPPSPPEAVAPLPPTVEEWVVEPGECFWSAAAQRVEAALGRAPSDGEIARYWITLMAANADRLRVAGDPGLVFPGQTFVLPPV